MVQNNDGPTLKVVNCLLKFVEQRSVFVLFVCILRVGEVVTLSLTLGIVLKYSAVLSMNNKPNQTMRHQRENLRVDFCSQPEKRRENKNWGMREFLKHKVVAMRERVLQMLLTQKF